MIETKRYIVRDPRPTREESPWTFYLPCEERIAAVTPGDYVQAIFDPEDDEGLTERMWIHVTEADADNLIGQLANDPIYLPMTAGEEVSIPRYAVIQIMTERKDDPEETNVTDERVFHRCWIDKRVYRGDIPPVKATNGHPQPEGYSGGPMNFPWGGWLIVGEGWTEGMPLEMGTPVIVIRKDPGLAMHILGEDEPTIVEKIDDEWKSRRA